MLINIKFNTGRFNTGSISVHVFDFDKKNLFNVCFKHDIILKRKIFFVRILDVFLYSSGNLKHKSLAIMLIFVHNNCIMYVFHNNKLSMRMLICTYHANQFTGFFRHLNNRSLYRKKR